MTYEKRSSEHYSEGYHARAVKALMRARPRHLADAFRRHHT